MISNSTLMGDGRKERIASNYNCYDCKCELRKDQAQRYVFKRPDGTAGDCIIVCEEHYRNRMKREKNGNTSSGS